MATLKEKQALLKQVEDKIQALQDEYDKSVHEKESLGKWFIKFMLLRKCLNLKSSKSFKAVISQLSFNR